MGQRTVLRMLVPVLALVAGLLALFTLRPTPAPAPILVGNIANFPPGSVTPLLLPATANNAPLAPIPQVMLEELSWKQRFIEEVNNRRPAWVPITLGRDLLVPVYVINDPQAGLLVLYRRDPQSLCAVTWQAPEAHFVDPCHGAWYTYTGEYIRGPAPRGLDRFGVVVSENGEVQVDVGQLIWERPVE